MSPEVDEESVPKAEIRLECIGGSAALAGAESEFTKRAL